MLIVFGLAVIAAGFVASCQQIISSPEKREQEGWHYRCECCGHHELLAVDVDEWVCQECGLTSRGLR